MSEDLRCLAIRQPWAWAVVAGAKSIENRSWSTPHRGQVVIQASSSKTLVNQLGKKHGLPAFASQFGALIGVADLEEIVPLSEPLESNPWAWGPHCWKFVNARAFREPIPLKGKLNLYTLPLDVADATRKAIETAIPIEHTTDVKAWLDAMVLDTPEERSDGFLQSYFQLGDGAGALRVATALLAQARTTDNLTEVARARFASDDLEGALQDINEAIELDPKSGRAFYMRGLIHNAFGEKDMTTAAELDPRFADEEHPAGEEDEEG
jgi:tetratricopeptide (TPR) repeat protein